MHTHYDTLQITRNASVDVIKGAYRYLSQKWHPDKQPSENRVEAERIMKEITTAYGVLSDPAARVKYDAWITEQEAHSKAEESGSAGSTGHSAPTTPKLSDAMRAKMAKSVASARWPLAILGSAVFVFFVFGLLLQINVVEKWTEAHAGWTTFIMFICIASGASSTIDERVKKLLATNEDQELELLYQEHSQRKSVIAICSTILIVGGVIGIVLAARDGGNEKELQQTTAPELARAKSFVVKNNCNASIQFFLMVGQEDGKIRSWNLDPGSVTQLVINGDDEFKVPTGNAYFYATSKDGKLEWAATRADFAQGAFNGEIHNFEHVIDSPNSKALNVKLDC